MTRVSWAKSVDKQLDRIPEVICRKFRIWVALVEERRHSRDSKCKISPNRDHPISNVGSHAIS